MLHLPLQQAPVAAYRVLHSHQQASVPSPRTQLVLYHTHTAATAAASS
jgi:hypothetical protein